MTLWHYLRGILRLAESSLVSFRVCLSLVDPAYKLAFDRLAVASGSTNDLLSQVLVCLIVIAGLVAAFVAFRMVSR